MLSRIALSVFFALSAALVSLSNYAYLDYSSRGLARGLNFSAWYARQDLNNWLSYFFFLVFWWVLTVFSAPYVFKRKPLILAAVPLFLANWFLLFAIVSGGRFNVDSLQSTTEIALPLTLMFVMSYSFNRERARCSGKAHIESILPIITALVFAGSAVVVLFQLLRFAAIQVHLLSATGEVFALVDLFRDTAVHYVLIFLQGVFSLCVVIRSFVKRVRSLWLVKFSSPEKSSEELAES
jgi:hypothetical protein